MKLIKYLEGTLLNILNSI